MHRIDDPTAVPTLPAPRPQGTPGYFTGGSPGSSGFAATVVRYEFMNALQEELIAVVAAAGLPLDKTNNAQLLDALRKLLRFRLFQDTHLYIDAAIGSDTNDGLTTLTPLKTGQAAWEKALQIDLGGHNLFLQFAAGTYVDPIVCSGRPLGLGSTNSIQFVGNVAQPNQVVFAPAVPSSIIIARDGAHIVVSGVSLRCAGTGATGNDYGACLRAETGSGIAFLNVIFQAGGTAHLDAVYQGTIAAVGPYTIAGGTGQCHALARLNGITSIVQQSVTCTGTPAFAQGFAQATAQGMIISYGSAFAGAVTGPRYRADLQGMVYTAGGGANYFPGSAVGTVDAATFALYA